MIQPLQVIQPLPSELEEGLGLAFGRPGSNSDRTKSIIVKGIRFQIVFKLFARMQRCQGSNLFASNRWSSVSCGVITGEVT